MTYLRFVFFVSWFLVSAGSTAKAQDTLKRSAWTQPDSSFQAPTGDLLDGINYHIKMVPLDTTLDEHMPICRPDGFVVVDVSPVPVKQVRPTYPPEARRSKLEGTVWIKCLIGKDGNVTRPSVIRSDAKIFNQAAIDAIKRWKFSPGRIKNKSVEVWVTVPFRFRLNK